MTDTELKPCPFCGGRPTIREARNRPQMSGKQGSIISVTIQHHCPKVEGQPSGLNVSKVGRDRESAIKAWNTRQPDKEAEGLAEALEREIGRYSKLSEVQLKLGIFVTKDKGERILKARATLKAYHAANNKGEE